MSPFSECMDQASRPEASSSFKVVAGLALLHAGRFDRAERLFQEVLERRPGRMLMATVMDGLGVAAKARGDLDLACRRLELAVVLDHRDWEPHYHLAECHSLLGNELAALIHLEMALALDGGSTAARQILQNPLLADIACLGDLPDRLSAGARRGLQEPAEPDALLPASVFGLGL